MIDLLKNVKKELMTFALIPVVFLIGKYISPENISFHGIHPHPYLIISVFLSSLYGLFYSFCISLAFSALYLGVLNFQLDFQKVETLYQVEYLVLPFVMIIISTILGDLKERDKKRISDLETTNLEKERSLKVQIDKNDILLKQEKGLRRQLVTKLETTDSLYKIAKKFSTLDFSELFQAIVDVVSSEINAESVAFYKIKKNENKLSLRKGFSRFQRKFDQELDIDLIENILVQRTINSGETSTLQHLNTRDSFNLYSKDEPLLVGAVWNGQELYGIVVAYDIPFLDYVPHNFKLFNLFCNWFSQSVTAAFKFNALSRNTIIDDRFSTYKYSYFLDRLTVEAEELKGRDDNLSVIKLEIQDFDKIPNEKKIPVKQTICKVVDEKFKANECVSTGPNYGEIFVMLPHHNKEQSKERMEAVMDEIKLLSSTSSEDYYHMTGNIMSYDGNVTVQEIVSPFYAEVKVD